MGILRNGLLGGVTGKVGNLVAYRVLGKEVVRLKGQVKTPATEKQLMNQQDMAVVITFLKPISGFIKLGFAAAAKQQQMYPHNKALSYHKKYALMGEYPNRKIDFSKVRLSEGNLQGIDIEDMQLQRNGLQISWRPTENVNNGNRNDRVMVLAYFPEAEPLQAHYCLNAAKRSEGQCLLPLPSGLSGFLMEVYVTVMAEDLKKVSDSQYLGRLNP